MAVPFGFSVGDFIAGIAALATTIKAVRDVGGSATQYQAIASELETLKNGLSSAQSLDREQRTGEEYRAVCEAAVACEGCINSFVMRIAKYQPWLKPGTDGWKATLRKIQWAFCNKKDLADFRQQLTQQTSTICLKILVLQTKENQLGRQVQEKCQNMMTEIQFKVCRSGDLLEDLSPRQLEHSNTIQQLILQNQRLLKTNQELGEQNGLLLSNIWERQKKLSLQKEQIPPQVLLQQPVRLLDACGYVLPFHLDFIDSLEAFLAVIKVKFRQRGVSVRGISKVDRLEFAFRAGQEELSLNRSWQALFRPGQTVNMSMKFRRLVGETTCPGCQFENEGNDSGEVECAQCRLHFRHVIEIQPPHTAARSSAFSGSGTSLDLPNQHDHSIPTESSSSTDELNDFRRVDIISPRPQPYKTFHDSVGSRKRKYEATGHATCILAPALRQPQQEGNFMGVFSNMEPDPPIDMSFAALDDNNKKWSYPFPIFPQDGVSGPDDFDSNKSKPPLNMSFAALDDSNKKWSYPFPLYPQDGASDLDNFNSNKSKPPIDMSFAALNGSPSPVDWSFPFPQIFTTPGDFPGDSYFFQRYPTLGPASSFQNLTSPAASANTREAFIIVEDAYNLPDMVEWVSEVGMGDFM